MNSQTQKLNGRGLEGAICHIFSIFPRAICFILNYCPPDVIYFLSLIIVEPRLPCQQKKDSLVM